MTAPLETDAGNFTVTVEFDVEGAESPDAAVDAVLGDPERWTYRVVRIAREYVPLAAPVDTEATEGDTSGDASTSGATQQERS